MNLEAEQHILGCALLDKNIVPKLLEIPEDWFLHNDHKIIVRSISSLASRSLSCDMFSLVDELDKVNGANNNIGMQYLNDLVEQVPSLKHFDSYKRVLFEGYKKSNISQVVKNLTNQIKENTPLQDMISYMQSSVMDLLTDHNESNPEPIEHYMKKLVDELAWQNENPDAMMGKQTGYKQLDETINGFEAGKVYVIGGRPGMGKTQFALNLGLRISKNDDTVIFSLEMTGMGLTRRALSNVGNLDGRKINGAKLEGDEWTQVLQAAAVIKDQNKIFIDETPNLSTAQIRARLKAHELKYGNVGCIIVDHIGLIKKNPKKNEREALSQISHELQAMSKEFKAPLIELVQLNRGVESGDDKRPELRHIKETSAIEEDARVIMFPYRDDYYNKDGMKTNVTELIIAKNSDGETKSIYFQDDMAKAQYTPIDNYIKPEKQSKKQGKFS